ncbi:hypothetical protein WOC76_12460 [Methylocystis sp. IM3]|uniref:hypothetical protein n=1 Tax=unclassified Methylocystis TaxID=2625913 RepID=UPI0030F9A324
MNDLEALNRECGVSMNKTLELLRPLGFSDDDIYRAMDDVQRLSAEECADRARFARIARQQERLAA